MPEYIVSQVPSIFRWKGRKQGMTMFSAQAGRLTLTSERLIFEPARGEPLIVPLGAVETAELTGKVIKNLTVGYRGPSGVEYSTFATQQFGMPQGQQWVDQITSASAAARGEQQPVTGAAPIGQPAAPPVFGDDVVAAATHEPYLRFLQAPGSAPQLVSWRLLGTLDPQVVEPATGRVELWGDVVAHGPIQYLHMAAGYGPDGALRVLVGAEVMPGFHDDCYLGVFADGVHTNLGAHDECRDYVGFVQRGVDVVLGVLDGARAAGATAPAGPPAPAEAPAPPPAMLEPDIERPGSLQESHAILRELVMQARQAPPRTRVELEIYLLRAAAACDMAQPELAGALRTAAQAPDDPARLAAAGTELINWGFPELATVALAAALRQGDREPATVEALAIAHDFAGDQQGAAAVLRDHAWAREASEAVRAFWTHIAAMTGDLAEVRNTLGELVPGGPFDLYRRLALDRLARAQALGPLDGDAEQPEAALRWWDAVLQGTVLVHTSPFGVEDMGGRYAALFDDVDRLGQVLAGLDASLAEAGRGRPARVLAAPDRDSEILGWILCARYGLERPGPLSLDALDAPVAGTTLVAAYTWTGVLDVDTATRLGSHPAAVLFAYSLEWTRMHRLVPDVVGVEVQTIVPPWGQRMRVNGMPGELPAGAKPEVVTIPADDREPEIVGREFAVLAAAAPADEASARASATVVQRFRDAGAPAGILGDERHMWYPGGPFESAHF